MKKTLAIILAAAMTASILTGCGSSSSSTASTQAAQAAASTEASSDDTIQIGVIAPLTGSLALYGAAGQHSVDLALSDINDNGGITIDGKSYKLGVKVFADDKSDSTEAVSAYNNCASYDISAIVGTYSSSCTLAYASLAQEKGLVVLTPFATNVNICKTGDYIFRACFSDAAQGPAMANFASEKLDVKKAAIVYAANEDYCTGLADAVAETFDGLGVEYKKYECTSSDVDYTAQIAKAVADGVDCFIYPNYLDTVPNFVQQARDAGFDGYILGGDGWDGSDTTGIEADFDNCFYANQMDVNDTSEMVQNYVSKYTEKFGTETLNCVGAMYYEAIMLLKQAIEEAGSADPAAIKDALAKINYTGLSGNITFDENGDPIKSVTFETFKDGKVTYYDKF